MLNTLQNLLPKGSLFHKTGVNFKALIQAISVQFEIVQQHYLQSSSLGDRMLEEIIEKLAIDYDLNTNVLTPKELKNLIHTLQASNGHLSHQSFHQLLEDFFPNIVIEKDTTSNNFLVKGYVTTYKQRRFLEWFLARFDRAKHKYIFDTKVLQTTQSCQVGVARCGIATTGGYDGYF